MLERVLEQLDALSVKLLAGVPELIGPAADPGGFDVVNGLRGLEATFRESGYPGLAEEAAKLAARAAEIPASQLEAVVTEGLASLRHAVQSPAPPMNSANVDAELASSGSAAISQDPELIADFVAEASEHLTTIESQILALERDPQSIEPLHAAFRSYHTIKGLAGFLELHDIRAVSHEVETLLDRARNRELEVTTAIIDVILESADYLKRAIAWVESGLRGTTTEPPAYNVLLQKVQSVLNGEQVPRPGPSESVPVKTAVDSTVETPAETRSGTISFTVRVDANKLDYLMDMVGELVIAQSLISHTPEMEQAESAGLQRNLQQLGRITSEVQRISMSLRMTPIGQLFTRMNRLTRDLARKNGKKVRLELSGEETELDKTIIEQLADPLMHMVRNSLDHGIEPPEDRRAMGKPEEGVVALRASHQAGNIVVEVSDDGRGLRAEKILRKARERGLVAEGANLSETEIFYLIFEPGFSTADQITDVSGRGVGMDVVRRQIQTLRGSIDIQSKPDAGTTFLLKLPLTLAIIDGLIVRIGGERYIIPISSVREMLRPSRDSLFTIEGKAEMALIRGTLLPIIRLHRYFAVPGAIEDPCEALFVVAEAESRRVCILVDEMIGKQEVVIKNLGEMFADVAGVSGGAILGDGRVGLILDINGLVRESGRSELAGAGHTREFANV